MSHHLYGRLPVSPQVITPFNPAPPFDGCFLATETGVFITTETGVFFSVCDPTPPLLVTDGGSFVTTDDGLKISLE